MTNRTLWAVLALVGALLCCTGTAQAGTLTLGSPVIFRSFRTDHMRAKVGEKLKRGLNLSATQEQQVNEILDKRIGKIERLIEDSRPIIVEQLDLMEKEVAAVLDEKQKRIWLERVEHGKRFIRRFPSSSRHHSGKKNPESASQ